MSKHIVEQTEDYVTFEIRQKLTAEYGDLYEEAKWCVDEIASKYGWIAVDIRAERSIYFHEEAVFEHRFTVFPILP